MYREIDDVEKGNLNEHYSDYISRTGLFFSERSR